jgi:hypothetical protein
VNDGTCRKQAEFNLGQFNLAKGVRDEAMVLIAAAADKSPADMLEKPQAKAELARLSR